MNKIYDTSTRFFPFWDIHNMNQLTGLINMIEYIFNRKPNAHTWCEIGVAAGESTSVFLGFSRIKLLYCIDPWIILPDYFKEFHDPKMQNFIADFAKDESVFLKRLENFKHAKKCRIYKGYSYDILPKLPFNFFDVIYIDAVHSYDALTKDLNLSLCKLKNYSFLCGHDYSDTWPSVKKAVDDFVINNHLNSPIIFDDTSFLIEI